MKFISITKTLLAALLSLYVSLGFSQRYVIDSKSLSYMNTSLIRVDSVVTSINNTKSFTTFYVNISVSNNYYLFFWIMGGTNNGCYSAYPLKIDGVNTSDSVKTIKADWQFRRPSMNQRYYFSEGLHEITLEGTLEDIPNVEWVKINTMNINIPISYKTNNSHYSYPVGESYRTINYNSIHGDSINSPNLFEAEISKEIAYTFFRLEYFHEGQVVLIESDTIDFNHHSVYLFNIDDPNSSSWSVSSSDYYNGHTSLTANITQSGFYYVMVRAEEDDAEALCNISINGRWYMNMPISNKSSTITHANPNYSYTCFAMSKTGDPMMWYIDQQGKVRRVNNNYSFDSLTSNFDGGTWTRINCNFANGGLVLVSSFRSYPHIIADVYYECRVSPNSHWLYDYGYKPDDFVISDGGTNCYNCLSWALGEWTYGVWETINWNKESDRAVFDSLMAVYGYTRTGTTENNADVDIYGDRLFTNNDSIYITHASIKSRANNYAAGYGWESKLGVCERIFHPRYALTDRYGSVIAHYRRFYSNNSDPGPFPGSFLSRVLANIHINNEENKMIETGISKIPSKIREEFDSLFGRCNQFILPLLSVSLKCYENINDYDTILNLCQTNPQLYYLIFRHVQKGHPLAMKLITDIADCTDLGRFNQHVSDFTKMKRTDDGRAIIYPLQMRCLLLIKEYLAYLYNQEVKIIDNQDITFSDYPFFSVKTEGRDVKVSFMLEKASNVWLGVSCPFSGYLNYIVKNSTLNIGHQELSFSLPNKGLYCISMVIDNEIFEKKIVVE